LRVKGSGKESFSVIVLAGGKGKRLGGNKALLSFMGRPLIEHVLKRVEELAEEILIVSDELKLPFDHPKVLLIPDVFPQGGPLGGIYSGLNASKNEWAFAFGCDMPFIQPSVLKLIALVSPGFDAVVPLIGGKPQPLHALYSKSCLEAFRGDLEKGLLKLTRSLSLLKVRYLSQEEIKAFDPHLISFFNINSPADLEKALNLIAQLGNQGKN
jgi:molybdopterin-guanine dinucleotide biosynthesis protein A